MELQASGDEAEEDDVGAFDEARAVEIAHELRAPTRMLLPLLDSQVLAARLAVNEHGDRAEDHDHSDRQVRYSAVEAVSRPSSTHQSLGIWRPYKMLVKSIMTIEICSPLDVG